VMLAAALLFSALLATEHATPSGRAHASSKIESLLANASPQAKKEATCFRLVLPAIEQGTSAGRTLFRPADLVLHFQHATLIKER
jgi:hypothetical protein